MTLPLLGRRNELRALQEAVEAARRGETVVLAVEGPPGSGKSRLLDEFAGRLQEDGFEVRRASAPEAGEARPGHVARQLRLEEPGPHGQLALLVDDAHWADPTSLGLLRRAGRAAGRLLVVAHQPVDGSRALVLRRLGEGAGGSRLLTLSTLSAADLAPLVGDQSDQGEELARTLVRQSGGNPSELEQVMGEWIDAGKLRWADGRVEAVGPVPERSERAEPLLRISALGTSERKLVEAAALAGRPLPLSVISPLLGLSSDQTLQTGERLAEAGYLQQSRQGFAVADHLAQRVAGEMGEVRRAALLDDLADALLRAGWAEREPAVVGSHLLAAGRFREALPLLAEVGLEAVRRGDLGQALPRLDGALVALEHTGGDPVLEGRLRLGRAQCYRSAGWSDLAAHDLEVAVRKLSGPERVDAFGWAAQIADDRQHLQEADRHLAAAEYEAAKAGEQAKLGSLLTLRARVLSRLGFPNEAHAALGKGNQLLQDHGNAAQRFRGRYNAAWTAFDQGRARQAEAAFEDLAQEAEQVGGLGSLADVEAWWARALFQVGHPEEALEVRRRALGHSLEAAASGPAFLSHMALAEGAQLFGRYQEALEAADEMLGLVLQQLPEWENAARYLRAQALLALGRLPEAAEEAQQAVDLCPPGIDGWRWRLKCRALQLEVGAAQERPWPAAEALELTDHLLHSQWFLTAAHLMTLRGRQEKDAELAADAAALAVQLGVPMVAAEAAHVAELWGERRGAAVARMVKQVDHRVPAEWLESWRQLPWVGRALQAEEVDEEDYQQSVNELHDQMQGALGRIGLADPDTLLSPAQRRAAGYVRRRRARSPWLVAAAVAAVVVLGGLAGLAGARMIGAGETVIIEQAAPTVTTIPTVEGTRLPPPGEEVIGQWNYRGDREGYASRTGVSQYSGVPDLGGYYWRFNTNEPIHSSPAVFGRAVIFGARDNNLYSLSIQTGEPLWRMTARGPIDSSPTVAEINTGEAAQVVVFFGSSDGNVYGRDAFQSVARFQWPRPFSTGAAVVSSPLVVDNVVYVGSSNGIFYALDAATGAQIWQFPTEGSILGSAAMAEGVVYVGSTDGKLYALDARTGRLHCSSPTFGAIQATPVVVDDRILIGTGDTNVHELDLDCNLQQSYLTSIPVVSSPAVDNGIMFVAAERRLLAIELGTNENAWEVPFEAGGNIESPPSITQGVVYVGSDDGHLYALDAGSGEQLWRFQTGGAVVSSPAIAEGAVFVTSMGGTIYALGPGEPPGP